MSYLALVLAAIYSAYKVVRSEKLLSSTIWLALTSALISILIYRLGASEVAVIELSVGAGLVTVLFVFAFSITGEATQDPQTIIPRPLIWCLVLGISVLLGWLTFPITGQSESVIEASFSTILWSQRGLDVLVQIVLIFCGVIGAVGLISLHKRPRGFSFVYRKVEQPVGVPTPPVIESKSHQPDAHPEEKEVLI